MFGSKLKVKAFVLFCMLTYLILPVTKTSADSIVGNNQRTSFQKIASTVIEECKHYKFVPPEVILAIIRKESGFNPQAQYINKTGTHFMGLMQINEKSAKTLFARLYPTEKYDIKKLSIQYLYHKYQISIF